ncbi:MAG: NUDIX hydrolase [Candidatus Shapirobacteria bacterium]
MSTKALIYKNNKILLIKEADGRWELPGGGLEVGETFVEGLRREIKEEIGVGITKVSDQPQYAWTLATNGTNRFTPKVMLAFKVEVDSFEFLGNADESVELKFFSKKDIKGLNLHPNILILPTIL